MASGDATSNDAIVWTRAVDPAAPAIAALSLQITTDSSFNSGISSLPVSTDPAKDYTAKLDVTSLQPATRYYYRFQGPASELSNIGTFKTAPSPTATAPVHFAFSGDMDGLIRPYALASTLAAQGLDFYVNVGYTIYETASNPEGTNNSPAVTSTGTLPTPSSTGATQAQLFTDFSRKYREQFLPINAGGQSCLKDFYAGQGNYTVYDNHELGKSSTSTVAPRRAVPSVT